MEKKYGASKAYKDKTDAGKARKDNRKAKRIRKGEEKADRKMYGKGEEGRKRKMAATAKAAAERKMDRAENRISSQTAPTSDGASKPNPNAKKVKTKKRAIKKAMKTVGKKGMRDTGRGEGATEQAQNLLKYSPVADREKSTMRKMGGPNMYDKKMGSSKPDYSKSKKINSNKKMGSSMNGEKYDAKEAYNKDLSASSRLHYLENERHDKTGGHAIHKHMKGFGPSMKMQGSCGASLPGTPAGSKSKRMTNLATQSIQKKKPQYTDSGQNYKDANNRLVSGSQVDEGEISSVIRKSPMRPHVVGGRDSMYSGEKLFLTKDKGSMMRTTKPLKQMKQGVKEVKPSSMKNSKNQGMKMQSTKRPGGKKQMKQGIKSIKPKK